LSAVEAQACGVPVVGAAADGLLETVADGESGLLIHSQSPRRLADAIVQLMRNDELWQGLSRRARHHALRYRSPAVEAMRWIAMVNRMRTGMPADRSRSRSGMLKAVVGFGHAKLVAKRFLRARDARFSFRESRSSE